MAKKDELPDNPQTMEDYVLSQLKQTVILKSGDTLVAVRRKDVDLDSKEGRDMALLDKRWSSESRAKRLAA